MSSVHSGPSCFVLLPVSGIVGESVRHVGLERAEEVVDKSQALGSKPQGDVKGWLVCGGQ